MTETSPAPRPPGPGRYALRGCLGAALLALFAFAAASWSAARKLDARFEGLKQAIADERASLRPDRPVRFGPAQPGNALDDYRALEWVLAPQDDQQAPPASRTLVELPRGHGQDPKLELSKRLHEALAALDRGQPAPAEAAVLARTFASVGRHVRDGLARAECDWSYAYEDGAAARIPALIAARQAAQLMALEAEELPPPEAARVGLQVVAFGADFARHPTLIGDMIGIAIKEIGLRSLERTLRRGPLTAAGYEAVIALLAELGPTDLAQAWRTDRLGIQVEIARLSGRTLGPPQQGAAPDTLGVGAVRHLGPLFWEREWAGYLELMALAEQAAGAPPDERAARQRQLEDAVKGRWLLIAAMAVPNVSECAVHADTGAARADLVRLLAAAHLHRLEAGALSADPAALAPRLGGALPRDPFRRPPAPLALRLEGGELTVWSVGRDGEDDGGHGHLAKADEARDVVVKTR